MLKRIVIDPETTVHWGTNLLPTLARFTLSATLLVFFWRSALTKIGDGFSGLWTPSLDAFVQVIPWRMEAVGYDPQALGWIEHVIVVAGMWAEILLPLLIAVGLFTRLSALAMTGFIAVMSLVDHFGHGVALGRWFDGAPDAVLMDQRLYWFLALMVLMLLGGGKLSVDRFLERRNASLSPYSLVDAEN